MKRLVNDHGSKNWKKISETLKKSPVQCLHRWTKILKPGLIKGPWSIDEDRRLLDWVRREGPSKWSQCAEFINGRSGKQCRERWFNTLHPEVRRGGWNAEEDFKIFKKYNEVGSKWSQIAKELPGRTENSIKNRFYSTLRRIAAETKKIKGGVMSLCPSETTSTISMTTTSINDLKHFINQAFEEKTKIYFQQKEKNSGDKVLVNNSPYLNELKENLKKDDTLLNKKAPRSFKAPKNTTTNINNNYNFSLNISSSNLIEALQPKKKNETVHELESAIEKWCGEESNLNETPKDDDFENLEVKINRLLEKDSCNQKKILTKTTLNLINNLQNQTSKNLNSIFNVECSSSINNNNQELAICLLSQLNELEKILQATKKEIYEKFEKKSEISEQTTMASLKSFPPINNLNSRMDIPISNVSETFGSLPGLDYSHFLGNVNAFSFPNFSLPHPNLTSNLFINNYNNALSLSNKPSSFEELYSDEANNVLFEHMFKF